MSVCTQVTISSFLARFRRGEAVLGRVARDGETELRDRARPCGGRARARARALTARRDGSFSVIYYTQVSKYNC